MLVTSGRNCQGSLEFTPPSNSTRTSRSSAAALSEAWPGPCLEADAQHLFAGDPVQRHQREREAERDQRHGGELPAAGGLARAHRPITPLAG
jgi:hypothetical protein